MKVPFRSVAVLLPVFWLASAGASAHQVPILDIGHANDSAVVGELSPASEIVLVVTDRDGHPVGLVCGAGFVAHAEEACAT